jgi:parallel beta-helix repeat protein
MAKLKITGTVFILSVFLGLFFFVNLVSSSQISISSCRELNESDTVYVLQNNVSSTETCFNVTANNVTLDCNGYEINHSYDGTLGYGVYSNQNLTTIRNCIIKEGTSTQKWKHGIYFPPGPYSPYNITIFNNIIKTQGEGSDGIHADSILYYSNISKNTLEANHWSQANGIEADIYYSTIELNNITKSNSIGIDLGGDYNNIKNNCIVNNTYTLPSRGFDFYSVDFSNITSNVIMNVDDCGISLIESSNNILYNNTIENGLYGICNWLDSHYNNLINNNANYNEKSGIYLYNSRHNIIRDSNISLNSENDTIVVHLSQNNTFLNCSYDILKEYVESGAYKGELIRKWYYRAYVNDSDGNNVEDVNVSAYDVGGNMQFSLLTGVDGFTESIGIIDYVNNGTRTDYSNYTINATKLDKDSHMYNATYEQNNLMDVFTVDWVNDTYKFYIKNDAEDEVAWLGNEGNIVLKGICSATSVCTAPSDSFIIKNSGDDTVAYIDSEGNMCIEQGDCSDKSISCNPTRDAFIVRDASDSNMSYIDFDGDLCLTGKLIEDAIL